MTLLDRINARPLPFATLLGIEFISAEPDGVMARMLVKPEFCTLGGVAHGGTIMSFADTLAGAAAFINLPDGAKGNDDAREQNELHRRGAGRLDPGRPLHARASRPPHFDLADTRRGRRRQACRARDADADDAVAASLGVDEDGEASLRALPARIFKRPGGRPSPTKHTSQLS